mgnify:CR=1 FL=1
MQVVMQTSTVALQTQALLEIQYVIQYTYLLVCVVDGTPPLPCLVRQSYSLNYCKFWLNL